MIRENKKIEGKYQHYVPRFYFRLFSKDKKRICIFYLPQEKFIPKAKIYNQCAEDYFYSENPIIEKIFSEIEDLASIKLRRIIENKSLDCLTDMGREHLKSHILFQYGRTKFMYDKENEMANYVLDLLKPKIYADAKKAGKYIQWKNIRDTKIVLNSSHSLWVSMLSGILLHDLEVVLLENKSKVDFIFSDNPVVFFNSYFNNIHPHGTTGMASTGLQIFYPINSKFMILLFDSKFYQLSNNNLIKIAKAKDIMRLNGLQILNCDKNLYFEEPNMKDKIIELYKRLKEKKPKIKSEHEVMGSRVAEDGTYRELLRTSSPKIRYNLHKLSFLKHKKTNITYGIRNKWLMDVNTKIVTAVLDGKIKSMNDLSNFLKEFES